MAEDTTITDAIRDAAASGIRRARGDEGEVETMPLDEQIRADKYLKQGAANDTRTGTGIRTFRMTSPGPTD